MLKTEYAGANEYFIYDNPYKNKEIIFVFGFLISSLRKIPINTENITKIDNWPLPIAFLTGKPPNIMIKSNKIFRELLILYIRFRK